MNITTLENITEFLLKFVDAHLILVETSSIEKEFQRIKNYKKKCENSKICDTIVLIVLHKYGRELNG